MNLLLFNFACLCLEFWSLKKKKLVLKELLHQVCKDTLTPQLIHLQYYG